jgi:hypothetical protein
LFSDIPLGRKLVWEHVRGVQVDGVSVMFAVLDDGPKRNSSWSTVHRISTGPQGGYRQSIGDLIDANPHPADAGATHERHTLADVAKDAKKAARDFGDHNVLSIFANEKTLLELSRRSSTEEMHEALDVPVCASGAPVKRVSVPADKAAWTVDWPE